jgi:hypothetical protein
MTMMNAELSYVKWYKDIATEELRLPMSFRGSIEMPQKLMEN